MTLQDAGLIGDCLGGILGTAVAGMAIWLSYKANREQIRANGVVREFQAVQALGGDVNLLRGELNELRYTKDVNVEGGTATVAFQGRAAVEVYADDFVQATSHDELVKGIFFHDLYFCIGRVDIVMNRITNASIDPESKKELLRDLAFIYTHKCLKGITRVQASVENHGKLKLTVNTTGMSELDHFAQMLKVNQRMMTMIHAIQV